MWVGKLGFSVVFSDIRLNSVLTFRDCSQRFCALYWLEILCADNLKPNSQAQTQTVKQVVNCNSVLIG